MAETAEAGARQVRQAIRAGAHTGPTAGLAPGAAQGNVAIIPAEYAADYAAYCRANPRPCPLLAIGRPGDPSLPELGEGIDIRHDLPRYRLYRFGAFAGEVTDIAELWNDDMVTFVVGCSFTFENALLEAGLALRHHDCGCNVPMYRTNIDTTPVGVFGGPLVVSMRPFSPSDAVLAGQISARYPDMHGGPIHIGDPAAIGIADLSRTDYGDPVPLRDGEVPLFWACGVTSQAAVEAARLPLVIAHAPGCMLITDRPHAAYARTLESALH
ncbi:MAG TPA: putative hydro-lyase [Acidisphaera sp.]|nr:putative hydro-lyase [Acidisphaera sp.]